jgi:cytidine diphosphoramidate kinase
MVVWMIGLSGAGKTALSLALHDKLKPRIPNLVRLDGDVIRAVFGNDVDHTVEGRRRNAERLSALSKFLADQNIHVIAAVLSIFPEWRAWNRANMTDYAEVYVKASMDTVRRRDTKGLYARALRGEIPNVVGVDIPFPDPESPELIIENDTENGEFDKMVERMMRLDVVRRALHQT